MDQNELTLAIAGALVASVVLGWILRWFFERLNNGSGPRSIRKTADMAAQLHEAENARAQAETRLTQVEADLSTQLSQTRSELTVALDDAARATAQAEEVRAAYRAAMSDREDAARLRKNQ